MKIDHSNKYFASCRVTKQLNKNLEILYRMVKLVQIACGNNAHCRHLNKTDSLELNFKLIDLYLPINH